MAPGSRKLSDLISKFTLPPSPADFKVSPDVLIMSSSYTQVREDRRPTPAASLSHVCGTRWYLWCSGMFLLTWESWKLCVLSRSRPSPSGKWMYKVASLFQRWGDWNIRFTWDASSRDARSHTSGPADGWSAWNVPVDRGCGRVIMSPAIAPQGVDVLPGSHCPQEFQTDPFPGVSGPDRTLDVC